MNKILIGAVAILASSCFPDRIDASSGTLTVGTCYHTNGDVGGTPDILHCVQTVGKDGFLHCQGSHVGLAGIWQWYSCGRAERFEWLDDVMVAECPEACPGTAK